MPYWAPTLWHNVCFKYVGTINLKIKLFYYENKKMRTP
jgi:hypothetical protein